MLTAQTSLLLVLLAFTQTDTPISTSWGLLTGESAVVRSLDIGDGGSTGARPSTPLSRERSRGYSARSNPAAADDFTDELWRRVECAHRRLHRGWAASGEAR